MTDLSLTVSKVINADITTTFDAWLKPESLATFMLPRGDMPNPEVTSDPREGGEFEILMTVGENKIPHDGVYKQIDRPNRLAFTWNSPFSIEGSLVTIDFEKVDDKSTKVTLLHEKFPHQESCDNHTQGWTNILDELDSFLR